MEDPLVGILGVSSITPMGLVVAGDEHLRGEIDIGPLRLPGYLDPVGDGGGSGEGPAATAVYGDMLVSLDGQVVGAADIAPPEVGGQFGEGYLGQLL